ncbi:hypothetical protein V7148_06035 [Gottfriedia acidiceleris]|uniref:hypothetical protein n=1 Tax=Bacillaceae TaxID=186817 RepID=UPI000BEBBB8A|nr:MULTISPECIES: hypothetical protein [unclassified Bacillus (in: firmicutes)]PEC51447.1 hypothetical protein CON00_02155 [Bacillus sp. AFS096315]PFM78757.1 hypothetical protein COJ46_17095 [Bacillus sp. AFS077874]
MKKMELFEKIFNEFYYLLGFVILAILSILGIKNLIDTWFYIILFLLIFVLVLTCFYHILKKFIKRLVSLNGEINSKKAKYYHLSVYWAVRITAVFIFFYKIV